MSLHGAEKVCSAWCREIIMAAPTMFNVQCPISTVICNTVVLDAVISRDAILLVSVTII